MANNRSNIRIAVKSIIEIANVAGNAVYTSRTSSFWKSELPAVIISIPEESNTPEALSIRRSIRDIQLTIEIKCKGTDSVDDELDTLCALVELAIDEDPSLNGSVLSALQQRTETRIDSDGDEDIGVATITYTCKYIA